MAYPLQCVRQEGCDRDRGFRYAEPASLVCVAAACKGGPAPLTGLAGTAPVVGAGHGYFLEPRPPVSIYERMAVIDTLKLARALRDQGGFTQNAADATAEALNDALGADVATKSDVAGAKTELRAAIDALGAELRAEIGALGAELRAEIAAVRAELKAEIDALGAELRADIEALRAEMRLLKWQIAIMYALQIAILVKLFVH